MEQPVRVGSVVGRPPATGVPHWFRAGSDMTSYPRTGTVRIRGLGVQFTL